MMKKIFSITAIVLFFSIQTAFAEPLGLPPVPIPADNPQSKAKIALGEKLFNDPRFSSTGDVSCATCHDAAKGFADGPLKTSEGIKGLTGTRNAPTVLNAAYMKSQFWDGREPDLEGQSKGPFINPVEMGLENHEPILTLVRADRTYWKMFRKVFGLKKKEALTMDHVAKAIASFERTIISGDSPFDHYYFTNDKAAMTPAAVRGFNVFLEQGRCVSCHTVSQTHALFTDSRFHNLNVNFNSISGGVKALARRQQQDKADGVDLDVSILTDKAVAELGRFVVTGQWRDIGAFKTPTLRNVDLTAPYMHDGSIKTLEDVVDFYNNGGVVKAGDPVNSFQSGGIRPLGLSDTQKADLVAFLKMLTSPLN
ncbi:MAG TPA: cytochrome-c peroxidase [Sphingomonadales bacterium]|nr:cytochrome-c peroxidase [Sphingomonadales bacterium]